MALAIVSHTCITCWACEQVCPNGAIGQTLYGLQIDSDRCTECKDAYPTPQCRAICPVDGAIINAEPLAGTTIA